MRYGEWFYRKVAEDGRTHVGPIVAAILEYVQPRSVIDVGCGAGHFLAEFARRGIEDSLGVDFPGIAPEVLQIPRERFLGADLSKGLHFDRTFDLALSLEVAEHIAAESADAFVDTLVDAAPITVFSAAIPRQGGYRHVNEQWPEYWADKFAKRGFSVIDCLRDRLWNDDAIPAYYRQNILMFANESALARLPLSDAERRSQHRVLSRVHPSLYEERSDPARVGVRFLASALARFPVTLVRSIGTQAKARLVR